MKQGSRTPLVAVVVVVVMLLAALPVAAGGQAEGAAAPVTIRVVHEWSGRYPTDQPAVDILNKVEADNPGMKLVHDIVPGDEVRNKIRVDAAAGNLPDVWEFWAGGVLTDYAKQGLLLDIEKYLAVSKKVKRQDIPEYDWSNCTVDGVIRAIPRFSSIGIFGANSEVFKKNGLSYPKTWAEFLALGKKFKSLGVPPSNIGSKGGNPSHFWFGELVCQYEAGGTATKTIAQTLDFTQRPFAKAAEYCDQMRAAGLFPADTMAAGDWQPSIAFYDQGNVAFCYTFSWCFGVMSPDVVAKTELIPIPPVPDAERDTSKFIQGTTNNAYPINAKSWEDRKKQPYIVAVADALAYDIPLVQTQMGHIVAVNTKVLKNVNVDAITDPMMVKTLRYRVANGVTGSPMIWQSLPSNKLQFDYQAGLDELWAGAITPAEYIAKVQKSFEEFKASQ